MILYPAIDLIDGKVVRLTQGDYAKKTEYSNNPAQIAKKFAAAGAEYLHIVDLDGAKAKKPINFTAIKDISEAVNIPLQVGGGIRTIESAEALLSYASRVIVGTIAITEPQKLKEMLEKFGAEKIVVSIDYKDNQPAVNGWLETSELTTVQLQERMSKLGIKTVIVTDISKDGLLDGPNVNLMKEWNQAGFEVIYAGGVSSREDVEELASANIDGAIIGKALYEGKFDLKEAIDAGQ